MGSVGVVCRLNCSKGFETLVPQLGLEHATPALQGRFFFFFIIFIYLFVTHFWLSYVFVAARAFLQLRRVGTTL